MNFIIKNPRYAGRPFLRLLECYVLKCIGKLPERNAGALKSLTPQLQRIYQRQGEWEDIVAAVMKLPPETPQVLREMWKDGSREMNSHKKEPAPQTFAEKVVDTQLLSAK